MNDAGRVMILPKGNYSATVQYDKLDSVTYNGSAWVATQSTIGNEPADDSDYWILFVKGGGVTADGTSLEMDADGVLGIKDGVIPDVDGSTIVKDDNNIIRIADALKKLIDGAVQEVAGKGLSTNDFTDTLLQKLNGIAEGANNYSLPDATSSIKGGVILSNSEAVTDSTGMALPATEKNASLEGTLANKISELNSNLGEMFTQMSQTPTEIESDVLTNLVSVEVPSGIYIILGNVIIPKNTSCDYWLSIDTLETIPTSPGRLASVREHLSECQASSFIEICRITSYSTPTNLAIKFWHNNPNALSISGGIRAIKLK